MSIKRTIAAGAVFAAAAASSVAAARSAAIWLEARTLEEVKRVSVLHGLDWMSARTDGLRVVLGGTAPDEASRFKALSELGRVIDAQRIIDSMGVLDPEGIKPPRFSIEVLRNDDDVSLIGLVPVDWTQERIAEMAGASDPDYQLTDFLERADHPEPDGWSGAVEFGIRSLVGLPQSKVSISAGRVDITALSTGPAERDRLMARLSRDVPPDVDATIKISSPRPVIAPFTMRFSMDEGIPGFDACSADTEESRERIIEAARAAGVKGRILCRIGLGVPTTTWADAVVTGIEKLSELGSGTITFSDVDVTLLGSPGDDPVLFERVSAELDADLPEIFSLMAELPPPPPGADDGDNEVVAEFTATRAGEGRVQIRGRVVDDRQRHAVESFARARFVSDEVHMATRFDEDLPPGWPLRVLVGLEALSQLDRGSLVVREDYIELRGETRIETASDEISRVLADKLDDGARNYKIDVSYIEPAEPVVNKPTPGECIQEINALIASGKIAFDPGSTQLSSESYETIDGIARILDGDCAETPMEIGGHTDSQGGQEMNQRLSQARADSVLNALLSREVFIGRIKARGYGELEPVADNGSEDGRERNRRIEFKLIEGDPAEPETEDQS